MKKILSVVVALFMLAGAFSESGLYAKLNAGWSDGYVTIDKNGFNHSVGYSGFEIFPAIGFAPEATSVPDKPFDFTFEASLGMILGNGSDYDGVEAKVINPAFTCFFNWHFEGFDSEFLQHFVPYAGAGMSTPIQFVKVDVRHSYGWWYDSDGVWRYHEGETSTYDDTTIGIDLTFVLGARYAFTEKIEANAETGWNSSVRNGLGGWFTRGGIFYRF